MKKYRKFFCLTILLCLVTLVGCTPKAKKPPGMPDLYPLSIKVAYDDGTPVVDAMVRLVDTSHSWVVGGTTDNQGNAIIRTQGEFPGAPAGNYKVVVSKVELVYGQGDPPPITDRFNLIEAKYTAIPTTDLTLEVKPDTKSAELSVGKPVREAIAGPPG